MGKSNPFIKELAKLARDRRERTKRGLVVVEGLRAVVQSLQAGAQCSTLAIASREALAELQSELHPADLGADQLHDTVLPISTSALAALATTTTPQSVVGVFTNPLVPLSQLIEHASFPGAVLLAEGVADPGNMGTMIRCCEAAGFDGFIALGGSDCTSPKTLRSSAGAAFLIPLVQVPTAESPRVLGSLGSAGFRVLGTALGESTDSLYDQDLGDPVAIVFGGEANGLSGEVRRGCDGLIRVPQSGRVESLNVAMSAAIVSFEVRRQRATQYLDSPK